jgi:hypothetical protein
MELLDLAAAMEREAEGPASWINASRDNPGSMASGVSISQEVDFVG